MMIFDAQVDLRAVFDRGQWISTPDGTGSPLSSLPPGPAPLYCSQPPFEVDQAGVRRFLLRKGGRRQPARAELRAAAEGSSGAPSSFPEARRK